MGDLHPSDGQLEIPKTSQMSPDAFVWATETYLFHRQAAEPREVLGYV